MAKRAVRSARLRAEVASFGGRVGRGRCTCGAERAAGDEGEGEEFSCRGYRFGKEGEREGGAEAGLAGNVDGPCHELYGLKRGSQADSAATPFGREVKLEDILAELVAYAVALS